MSDDLLVPDRSIVSLDQAREEVAAKKAPVRRTGSASDYVMRKEIIDLVDDINTGIGTAAAMVGQQAYDTITEELNMKLEAMEAMLLQQLFAEIERRSWRGRWRRFMLWVRASAAKAGAVSLFPAPALVPPDTAEKAEPARSYRPASFFDGEEPSPDVAPEGLTCRVDPSIPSGQVVVEQNGVEVGRIVNLTDL